MHDKHEIPASGHLGRKKTLRRLRENYHWKNMSRTVAKYVASCDTCQKTKSSNHKPFGLLQPLEPPTSKWTHITMDFVKRLPKTNKGNSGILVVVDRLSKMIRIVPFQEDPTAPETAKTFL